MQNDIAPKSSLMLYEFDKNSIIYKYFDSLHFIYFKTHIRNKATIMENL